MMWKKTINLEIKITRKSKKSQIKNNQKPMRITINKTMQKMLKNKTQYKSNLKICKRTLKRSIVSRHKPTTKKIIETIIEMITKITIRTNIEKIMNENNTIIDKEKMTITKNKRIESINKRKQTRMTKSLLINQKNNIRRTLIIFQA